MLTSELIFSIIKLYQYVFVQKRISYDKKKSLYSPLTTFNYHIFIFSISNNNN